MWYGIEVVNWKFVKMSVLKLSFVYGYLGKKPEEMSRALGEGEGIEKSSNRILNFGITQKYGMKTQVKAYCLTSSLNQKPHIIDLLLEKSPDRITASGVCSCRASGSKCKHIIALMLWMTNTTVL